MARQDLNQQLYQATVAAFARMGMPAQIAEPAAQVIATDSVSGTADNPTERTPDQQLAVWSAWGWAYQHDKIGNQSSGGQPHDPG